MLLALLHGIVQFLLDVLVQHQKAEANLRIDAKFTTAFDEVFRREGVEVIPLPYRAPRANSFADRFVGTARRELLDHVLICGRRHLEHVLREFIQHSEERPHPGLEQRVPRSREPTGVIVEGGPVLRRDRLGCVPHEYFRQVA